MRTFGTSPFGNIPPVVKNLLIINILLFIAKELLPGLNMDQWLAVFYPDSPYFRIWQPVSYMFMHADIFHIFFNMFALYTFGTTLEFIMGSKRFINFYLITGIGAYLVQAGVQAFEVHQILGSVRLPESVTNVTPGDLNLLRAIATGPMVVKQGDAQSPVTVLAAHRDTHFLFIRDLREGDIVTLQQVTGEFARYRVTLFETVRWNEFAYPLDPPRPLLALTTCYPFGGTDYGGPWRRVAWAEAI